MYKSIIAIFFTSLFMTMIITPSVVTIMDLDYDIILMLDMGEEEEKEGKEGKEGKESVKDKEVKILQLFENNLHSFASYLSHDPDFYLNTYTFSYKEIISPPPEQVLSI